MAENSSQSLHDVQMAFAGHIRDPEKSPAPSEIEDRRMAIYRDLFFNNLEGFLSNSFPVIRKLYGHQRWHSLVRDFMIHHRAHTPLFPELPREFLQFIEHFRGADQGDPPFLLELAHYEWVELALAVAEGEFTPSGCDEPLQLLDCELVKSPLAWLLSYNFPAHQIRHDFQPTEPSETPTHLVVYRRPDFEVKFLELNAVSARLLNLIDQQTATGKQQLSQVAQEIGIVADEQFFQQGAGLLADLVQRTVIGPKPN